MGEFTKVSRFVILVPVIALLCAAVAVFLFGGLMAVSVIRESFAHAIEHSAFNADAARVLSVELIELIDVLLLGTVLVLTGVGLYELFIDPDLAIPEWLSVKDLEQLKKNVVAVIIVMLGVMFTGAAAAGESVGLNLFLYGAATALVIAALSFAVAVFAHVRAVHVAMTPAETPKQESRPEARA